MTAQATQQRTTRNGTGAKPAPAQLATPTDLTPQEVAAVSAALNPIIADHFALYVKTKNFHWHLATPHFRDYHLLFDEQADAIFAAIDVLAERVRRIGGTTIRSVGDISRRQQIADNDEEFVPAQEMVRQLMEDNKATAQRMRAAHEVAENSRDVATASILETLIDETERYTWFLYEITQQ